MDLHTVTTLVRPADDGEARAALGPGVAPLAGGTWLYSEPQPHLHTLVDLSGLRWPPLTPGPDGLEIAATCTLAELVDAGVPLAREACAALAASFKIAHTATVGGNVCVGLPAGALTALCVALDGVAVVWTPSGREREVPVHRLVTGVRQVALAPGELLRAIRLPAHALAARSALRRTALSAEGRSGAVVTGRRDADGQVVLGVTAATERPHRFAFRSLPDGFAVDAALATIGDWYADPHGAPDWREHVTGLLAHAVLAELV